MPEETGLLWEAWKKPCLIVWVTLRTSVPQFPHLSNSKRRSRETVPPVRLIPGGCPHLTAAEAAEPRRLGPAPQAGQCLTRSIRCAPEEGDVGPALGGDSPPARPVSARTHPSSSGSGSAPTLAPASAQPTCPRLSAEPQPSPSAAGTRGFRASSRDPGARAGDPDHVLPRAVAPLQSRSSGARRRSTTWRPVAATAVRAVLRGSGAWGNWAGR